MSKTTIPLHDADQIASMLVTELTPVCQRIAIAGSVRRRKPEVGDIEIVCVPDVIDVASMFPELGAKAAGIGGISALDSALTVLRRNGILSPDTTTPRNGPKYKRLIVSHDGTPTIPLDLFIADTDNYGNTLAIRTGDAEFSRALVTQRRAGGLMPSYLKQKDGYLWNGDEMLPCPNEAMFLQWLELPADIDPRTRDEATAQALARRIRVARAGMGER